MLQIEPVEKKQQKRLIVTWSITFLIIFPLMITLGLLMRMNQGEDITLSPDTFYALMTLHGLGMASILFSIAFASLWYLISTRYTRLQIGIGYFVYAFVIIGLLGLTYATLVGKFGAGWYMLYPLPFKGASWTASSVALSSISIIILGVAWLVGMLHLLYSLAKEYGGVGNLLGFQYLRKRGEKRELPPIVLITTVSLIPGVIAFLAGAVMLILYLLQYFEPSLAFDPLLLKNLTFFFGHTLVNITLYCGVGWVYALLPEYTGREWKTNKILVYSWDATLLFILFAYFHHLYMDFVQPLPLQYAGQVASYLSAIPATAITMFGVIAQLYHSKVKWGIVPLMFLLGTAGWAIGGFAAIVDSTIAINKLLHNTLWVPAHFHTYMLGGIVLFIFAFLFYLSSTKEQQQKDKRSRLGFWLFLIGVHGFIATFYMGGAKSIPRRFSDYSGIQIQSVHLEGAMLARIAVYLISLLLVGLLVMYVSLFINLLKRRKADSNLAVESVKN